MDGLSNWAEQNSGFLAVTGFLLTVAIAVLQIVLNRRRGGPSRIDNQEPTAGRQVAIGWLCIWLALLVSTVGIGLLSVMQFGLPGLTIATLMLAFIGSLPAWITFVVPSMAQKGSAKKPTPEDGEPSADIGAPGHSELSNPRGQGPIPEDSSGPNKINTAEFQSPPSEVGATRDSIRKTRRQPGSKEYKELMHALRSALPDQPRILRVVEFAGLNRGDVEDGYVDATTRWSAVMRLALDSDKEEDVCLAALDASPRRDLRDAITAYLAWQVSGFEASRITVRDLSEVITTLSRVRPDRSHTREVLNTLEVLGQEETAQLDTAKDRWRAAINVAIDCEGDYLRRLFDIVREDLLPGPRRELNSALEGVGNVYVQRVIRTKHPELGDQVEELNSAGTFTDMKPRAETLRRVALNARRMLMDPQLGVELMDQLGTMDPERRRLELADLAIDVVTATDYLLHLVNRDESTFRASYTAGHGTSSADRVIEGETEDARFARALDARAAAVRLGGRLLYSLRQDTVAPI